MRTSDVTQLMDLALGLWFPFVRIMAFLHYVPVLDNSALTMRVRIILSLALGQIRKVVPKANVVITNPTHYAVALQYDQSRAAAPFVVAKGTDEIALYIRQVATENQVEVVEFPRLARSVYYTTQVNQQIPFQLYRAIAHVLTYVLQMKHWRDGAQPRPALNRHISIPKEVLKLDGENN